MRGFGLSFAALAALGVTVALFDLLAPVPRRTDLAGFSLLALGVWSGYVATSILAPRGWWTWAFPSAWVGLSVSTLFLAYRKSFRDELAHFGPVELGWHVALHALIAPIEVFFGFAIGFLDPEGAIVVLACLALALLGGEMLRRRLWPREKGASVAQPRG